MNADDILLEMKKLAQDNGVELTDNAINIARFRARANIPLSVCPCCRGDTSRYCISYQCLRDIEILGKCHCQAFHSCK
jgi:hypothetical protein